MCLETMDAGTKHTKNTCLHKMVNAGSRPRWRLLQNEALTRSGAVRAALRKCLRREQRRARLAKLAQLALGPQEEQKNACEESPAEVCLRHHPSGAMAPQNTTQYLMRKEYEDMETLDVQVQIQPAPTSALLYGDCLSPRSVDAALDAGYEACLTHQQRDFEEMFSLCW